MNRTSPFELQPDTNKHTMSPILQCDISDKMTITSIKHKTIKNHHKFRRNKDTNDAHHSHNLKLNELHSSRKIASIIHETEDNIQEILKLNATDHDHDLHLDTYHHHHRYTHRSSSHRNHKLNKLKPSSRHSSSTYHANSHRDGLNHPYNTKHSLHSMPKRSPPPPPVHSVFLDEFTHTNDKRKRGKKRKRDLNIHTDTDDTISSHHSSQPRKRRKKSSDKSDKTKRHRDTNHHASNSSSSSSTNTPSSSSYHPKHKRKKKSKETQRSKKRKRDDSESDDNRKKEKHKEENEANEQKTQHEIHLSPSPSLSISSLTNKLRSRSRKKNSYVTPQSSRSPSPQSTDSSSASSTDSSSTDTTDHLPKRERKRKIIRGRKRRDYECDYESLSSSWSSTLSTEDSEMEEKRLPTTRNLLVSGTFAFDRMSEEDITREIRYRFESDTAQVQFWKYPVCVDGQWFCRHLDCVSVSFTTSRECQDQLSRFVLGWIDLRAIGEGMNVSLDEYKSRANKYHQKHADKWHQMSSKILAKKRKKTKECDDKMKEMGGIGRCYWLPLPSEALEGFERARTKAKTKAKTVHKIEKEVHVKPPHKKRKVTLNHAKIEKKAKIVKTVEIAVKTKKMKSAIIESKKMISAHQNSLKMKRSKHEDECGKTWRDYLHLYEGKESLAQLHFECMQQLKKEVIETCVKEEHERIMEMRNKMTQKKKKKKKAQAETKTKMKTNSLNTIETKKVEARATTSALKKGDDLATPQSPNNSQFAMNLPQISFAQSNAWYAPQYLALYSYDPYHQHPMYPSYDDSNSNSKSTNKKGFLEMKSMPNFDLSRPYCDTVSSCLSNTSGSGSGSSLSSHSITSMITTGSSSANSNELISKNGHWIIRKHTSGCARSEGFYSLAPSAQGRKHRHLAAAISGNSSSEAVVFGVENARHLRLHKRAKNIQFGKSSIHSWGVFALEEMNAEEMVVEYIGEYINEKYANLREKLYDKQGYDDYMFRVEDNLIIDATKKGNLARFINHSCDPNCYTRIIQVNNTPRVVIYSKRIIKAGEELTYDYKFPIEHQKIKCLCAAKNCRGTLN